MKSNKIFIIWGILIGLLVVLLLIIGINFKKVSAKYEELEETLKESAIKYIDINFLYPEEGESNTITSDTLIENDYLDELAIDGDVCTGYVTVTKNGVYEYKAYIKCDSYKTSGYKG